MLHFISDIDVRGYTLVLPSVSVGNVGQLAIDLWIATLNCMKIGYIWHPAIMPVAGGNPFSNVTGQPMTTSSELYCDNEKKLIFIQIRSPVLKNHVKDFIKQLVSWAECHGIVRVVTLTGSTYLTGTEDIIRGDKLHYVFSPKLLEENKATLGELKWKSTDLELPGSGFARMLHELCEARNVGSAVLVKYCAEGDNVPDAYQLAEYLNQWIKAVGPRKGLSSQWKEPPSWNLMFGRDPEQTIY